MKKAYLYCLKKLRQFRKTLISEKDQKRGKMYFSWLETKTGMVENEKNDKYIYDNIVKNTLPKYIINEITYKKLNNNVKKAIDRNYSHKKNYYVFNNPHISYEDTVMIANKVVFRRGNVVWVDFGFNIGNEFGGMHPAIILKNFDKELFVLPVSSKKPMEYKLVEQEFENGIITEQELIEKKAKFTEIVQLNSIVGYRNMIRWANITRMKKISVLRLNFSGTVGRIDGKYINEISQKIKMQF